MRDRAFAEAMVAGLGIDARETRYVFSPKVAVESICPRQVLVAQCN
jgi:hypothetical protein